ncbi:MAG: aquaporin [Candidatus Anstonellaceae archaeon]
MEKNKFYAELFGTFILTFIGSMAVVSFAGTLLAFGAANLLAIALAHGLALAIAVYAVGHISGAHVNPAITIGFLATGKMKANEAGYYVFAQLVGAGIAGLLVGLLASGAATSANYGAPLPGNGVAETAALGFEVALTGLLAFVVLSTAADKRSTPGWHGFAIGMTLAVAILAGGAFSGASLNPARSFGPALAAFAFDGTGQAISFYWIYVLGPMVGGVLGAFLHKMTVAAKK